MEGAVHPVSVAMFFIRFKAEKRILLNLNSMRIATINVPKGCKEIFVDIEESGKLIVSYGSSINRKEFFCQETDHVEEVPGVGDFAILWNKGARERAVVANIEKNVSDGPCGGWISSSNYHYDCAIKFRDYEQYLKIRGKYAEEDEP